MQNLMMKLFHLDKKNMTWTLFCLNMYLLYTAHTPHHSFRESLKNLYPKGNSNTPGNLSPNTFLVHTVHNR